MQSHHASCEVLKCDGLEACCSDHVGKCFLFNQHSSKKAHVSKQAIISDEAHA